MKRKVIVRKGIDVKKQKMGENKGELFRGGLDGQQTYYVNPAVKVWHISFDDLMTGKRLYKRFTGQLLIGRKNSNQEGIEELLFPEDGKVSRRHCRVYDGGGRLCLQDLQSRNHTYLNGKVISKPVYLNNGDIIQLGDRKLRVQYDVK